ncbi:hypothetical protein L3X38_010752 [Prunus dulcis]|uniref:RecA family profile 1 domain-containing protein n=1 Tax=Prunus dulcis TaxID=3755 RepID=A0AAD4ZER1_PRUDU|nr:hypothetical protein L3X38_010752 [Prunus dulcis]
MFFNISGTLKGLANKFGLAVVVTNQVVDFIGPHDKVNGVRLGNLESLDTSGRWVSPALGLAWAHCINSRVFLARHEQSIEPARFCFWELTKQLPRVVTHPGIAPASHSLNFGVLTTPKPVSSQKASCYEDARCAI